MDPYAPGQLAIPEKTSDSKKWTTSHLSAPLEAPPVYYAVYEALPLTHQDFPRNAPRRRCWHYVACSVLFIGAMRMLHKGPASASVS